MNQSNNLFFLKSKKEISSIVAAFLLSLLPLKGMAGDNVKDIGQLIDQYHVLLVQLDSLNRVPLDVPIDTTKNPRQLLKVAKKARTKQTDAVLKNIAKTRKNIVKLAPGMGISLDYDLSQVWLADLQRREEQNAQPCGCPEQNTR